jgi:hypothetical protein
MDGVRCFSPYVGKRGTHDLHVAKMRPDEEGGWVGYGDYLALRARLTALEAELKALKDAPVPAKVPDDEMIGAGVATLQRFRNGGKAEDLVRDIYTAMLAAAQEGK